MNDVTDTCEYCGEKVKSVYWLCYRNKKGEVEHHFGHKYCLNALQKVLEELDENGGMSDET